MKRDKEMKDGLSRRNFLKTTAASVSATALTGFSAATARAAGVPTKWDKEADVVVVGCGGAGTTAAITAHDAGAKVIIIEKAPEAGGNSRVGGGQFCYSNSSGKDDAAAYMHAVCNGTTPMEVCQAWADEIVHNREWLTKMEVPFRGSSDKLGAGDYPAITGTKCLGTGVIEGYGPAWYKAIEKQLKDRGIEILFNSPATELIQNPITKEILGVKVKSEGRDKSIKAKKGVVLTTGGFEFNEDMKKNYLRPSTIKFTGWKYNTGDGIKMAQAVGADLWHMNMIASALYTIVTPDCEMGWMYPEPKGSNFILVTKYGERFMKEGAWFPHRSIMGYSMWDWRQNRKDSEYPCCPHYMIFDETTRLAGPIGINEKSMFTGMGNTITPISLGGRAPGWGEPGGGWSQDNSEEIKKGWIKKADSIAELAKMIGGEMISEASTLTEMPGPGGPPSGGPPAGAPASGGPPAGEASASGGPPAGAAPAPAATKSDALSATVKRWNEFCDAGVDSDFGRNSTERSMIPHKLEKIQTPPFYAIELWPGGFSTMGGPKKNAKGQVLGVDEKPIKRLYAAGSLGHTLGQVYGVNGANYGEVLAWGRISGRNAAAEKPWG